MVGGRPVAVTFCPLCNSSLVFDREVLGATMRFGVSGNLRNSDLIMWDDITESWWQQLTGEAIVGDLAGYALEPLPAQLIGYGEFKASFPNGVVLGRDTGIRRDYGRNPYPGYDSASGSPFLFRGRVDDRLRSGERVVALALGGEATAYAFTHLKDVGVVNDVVGGLPVVVLWSPDTVSALDARVHCRRQGRGVRGGFWARGRRPHVDVRAWGRGLHRPRNRLDVVDHRRSGGGSARGRSTAAGRLRQSPLVRVGCVLSRNAPGQVDGASCVKATPNRPVCSRRLPRPAPTR